MARRRRNPRDEEFEDDFNLQGEMETGVVIGDARGGGYDVAFEGRHLAHVGSMKAALIRAVERMEKMQYWPNVFYVNDHGNVSLLAYRPAVFGGKVVAVKYKTVRSWV
jgi:hypothetical protein